jgi:hypothetical protein
VTLGIFLEPNPFNVVILSAGGKVEEILDAREMLYRRVVVAAWAFALDEKGLARSID